MNDDLASEQERLDAFYERLDQVRAYTETDLDQARHGQTVGTPGARTEQEAFVRLYAQRLTALNAAEERLCFGRLDLLADQPRYIGRIGLTDDDQSSLLTDWRAPAAEAFYQATAANPGDVIRRRHLVTQGRTVASIEDDVLNLDAIASGVGGIDVDDVQGGGVLMAALARKRTGRMQDIVATLQAEQDVIVRSPISGIVVVEGGPGCGKTVVALHRAAYLLYTHRDRLARSGVLIIGPNPLFLRYIEQVLPALGETSAVLATPGTVFPGIDAGNTEPDEITAIKGQLLMADVVARAVKNRQRVPDSDRTLMVGRTPIIATTKMFAHAIDRARSGHRPHNASRRTFALTMLSQLAESLAEVQGVDITSRRDELIEDLRDAPDVRREVNLAWMPLTPEQVITDLWTRPDVLAAAAPQLSANDRHLLHRLAGAPWAWGDVPLLDEAAELLGIDDEAQRQAQAAQSADRAAETEYATSVLEMTGTKGVSAEQMIDRYSQSHSSLSAADRAAGDREWVFGHVVVDEAQELSPMMWRLLARRCPSLSMTVVGDLDQAGSRSAPQDWAQVLQRIAKPRHKKETRWRVESLTINYRTPRPFMNLAQSVLRAAGRTPMSVESIRDGEHPVIVEAGQDWTRAVGEVVMNELADADLGRLAVITAADDREACSAHLAELIDPDLLGTGSTRLDAPVCVLSAREAKGLEFDVAVVCEPAHIETQSAQPGRDLYVALTRSTRRLIIVHHEPLPKGFVMNSSVDESV
ncbi:MAG: ATP-binding domain-containing protein [Candidatus Nanopelagicales bacterium]